MTTIIWDDCSDVKPVHTGPVFGDMIPWSGGKCPVAPSTIVTLHFRGRRPYVGPAMPESIPAHARAGIWQHAPYMGRVDARFDVIAYQVAH